MGYRFGDFLDDVVKPGVGIFNSMNPLNNLMAGLGNIASSMSMPLMLGGAAVLIILVSKK